MRINMVQPCLVLLVFYGQLHRSPASVPTQPNPTYSMHNPVRVQIRQSVQHLAEQPATCWRVQYAPVAAVRRPHAGVQGVRHKVEDERHAAQIRIHVQQRDDLYMQLVIAKQIGHD